MPSILFNGEEFHCHQGDNLRQVLLASRAKLYNGPMGVIHCRGLGTCGTCAVRLVGAVSPPTRVERWRLQFPPHHNGLQRGLRLACQCRVEGDLQVEKLSGWWGHVAE